MEQAQIAADGVDRDAKPVSGFVGCDSPGVGDLLGQPCVAFTCERVFVSCRAGGHQAIVALVSLLHVYARICMFGLKSGKPASTVAGMSTSPHPWPSTNPHVRVNSVEVLSDNWYTLNKVSFDYQDRSGRWSTQQREAYDRGNGATVLLIDWDRRKVLLTRQFRVPAYLNGHPDGMLIETAAGLLDDDDAETAIRREAAEETGCEIGEITRLFELFMSPGSVTERIVFFVATYAPAQRSGAGGGLVDEGEDIEVIELDLDQAVARVGSGEIVDGKTVLLLQWAMLQTARRS